MYMWLLETRQPQCRHEKEIKADCSGNNNGILCTQPTASRYWKCRAVSCSQFECVNVFMFLPD